MKNQTKQKKRKITIGHKDAVHRIDQMIELIYENVLIALRIKAALEEANSVVVSRVSKAPFYGAHCYNTAKDCMALNFALTLARLFDPGAKRFHANKSDVASIPLLIRLLKQKRCKAALATRARSWTPNLMGMSDVHESGCRVDIDLAIAAYAKLRRTHGGREGMATLKRFRDKKLAHSLIGAVLKALPRYRQLFVLMDVACDITRHARHAIRGSNVNFDEFEREWRREANAFWEPALKAVTSTVAARSAEFKK